MILSEKLFQRVSSTENTTNFNIKINITTWSNPYDKSKVENATYLEDFQISQTFLLD